MRLSVICPVHNTAPAFLHAAAASVLDDTTGHVAELILVDDASDSAETRAALQVLAGHPRVTVLVMPANAGPAAARNLGIAAAAGDWIGFIDADDLWPAHRLAAVDAIVAQVPDTAWIAGRHSQLDAQERLTPSADITDHHAGTRLMDGVTCHDGPDFTKLLIANYWLHLGACLIRRDLLQRLGGFAAGLVYSEDWLLCARLSTQTALVYEASPVYVLRRQTASLTTSSRRLTMARAKGHVRAMSDPLLVGFRRELRWALYGTWKGLAANNLLAGHRVRGLGFALRAWAVDPREVREMAVFLRCLGGNTADLRQYTHAELMAVHSVREF